ncbi:hypothetical protein Anas_04006 [Armadillidium nasatum]|uniref:Uncharacterized protein n=1 Tax=Armadillidium nasatum TaxID=96803 RepID=A0A5N5T6V1_9CRUS|nr:hypothetical protein Anas_04006 [Armadillidium nasatum]
MKCRLLESVERSRAEKSSKDSSDKAKQSMNTRGRSGSKTSLGDSEFRRASSPERKKSILKHRDPEAEQLLPQSLLAPSEDRPKKPRALPVKFVGLDDKDDDETRSRPRRVLPRSPMPLNRDRAPLADFLADFGGQEKAVHDELTPENLLKDNYEIPPSVDNSNNINKYKCTHIGCSNTRTIPSDSKSFQNRTPKCVCGFTMMPVATTPINILVPTPPTIVTAGGTARENRLLSDELNNGPTPVKEIEDLLFVDQNSPSEETRLLGGPSPLHKGPRLNS